MDYFHTDDKEPMYIGVSETGGVNDENSYTLLGRVVEETQKPTSLVGKLATSKPVKAIDSFNKAFIDLMVSSIGFVAALSWNDYFKSLFQEGGAFYKTVGASGLLYVAIFATILAYIATVFVTSIFPEREIAKKNNPINIGN